MGTYGDWLANNLPGGFQTADFLATLEASGDALDAQEDFLRQAILVGFPTAGALDEINFPTNPQYALSPSDGLDAIGADRGLPRGVVESPGDNGGPNDQAYAARLLGAWAQWKYGAAHYGILRALAIAGFSNMVIVQQNGRFSELTGSGGTIADMTLGTLMLCENRISPWTSVPPGWTFDAGDQTFWAKLGIVFTSDASNLQPNGDGSLSAGQLALYRIVKGWKASEMVYVASWVILHAKILGWPTSQVIGSDGNLGAGSVRIIPGDGATESFVEGP